MSTIEELERQILQLRKEMQVNGQTLQALTQKSAKALDAALHAYKVDHYGIIWVWDTETQGYRKTQMRVCSPEIPNEAVTTEKMANGAVTGDKIQEGAVTGEKIAAHTIKSFNIAPEAVTAEKITDQSITGDDMERGIPNGKLADNAVAPRNIQPKAITFDKMNDETLAYFQILAQNLTDRFNRIAEDLENQVGSLDESGAAFSDRFGPNPHIGISQQALTDAWNNVYHLLEEALGRTLLEFTWEVTSTYIYGEWPTTVHITAHPTNPEDKFEYIKLSVNGETVDEVTEKRPDYAFDIDLQDTVDIRMDAQVLGKMWYRETTVNHYDSFWLGGGNTYTDIMDQEHNINISEGTRLAVDVTITAEKKHIIIMMGDAWVPAFIRADMNGVEIKFDDLIPVTIDGKTYKVLVSESEFEAGTYNIDING